MKHVMVAPSILAVWDRTNGDYAACVTAAQAVEKAGADWLHVDVMDGQYVPAKTFGPEMVEKLKGAVKLPLDIHLMVNAPERVIADYIAAGADRVVFHPSASDDVGGCLQKLVETGVVAGLAIDADENVLLLAPWVDVVQQVLVMTVKAGAGGQGLRDDLLAKVAGVRALVGKDVPLVVDGGVKVDNAARVVSAGADVLVAGSAVFNAPDVGAVIGQLRV
ncbi:MAG TPA: ribulose-phosphate 3-epimerase [Alphaproteobacteria bacterium]|nr:ribulose-phosphate 3-epimerase [Alphaproteobacteria bacterium]